MANITRLFDGDEINFFLDQDGNTWLRGTDCCRKLGLENVGRALSRLKDSQKQHITISDAVGKPHRVWFISPQGLYKLAFTSRKPEAEAFTDWVADTIEELRQLGFPLGASVQHNLELLKRLLLAPDKQSWVKRFEQRIFERLEWFKGRPYHQSRPKKWHSTFLRLFVYEAAFGREVYKSIKAKCPKPQHGDNLHQYLTPKGLEVLLDHLAIIDTLLYSATSYPNFKRAFNTRFRDMPPQLGFAEDGELIC